MPTTTSLSRGTLKNWLTTFGWSVGLCSSTWNRSIKLKIAFSLLRNNSYWENRIGMQHYQEISMKQNIWKPRYISETNFKMGIRAVVCEGTDLVLLVLFLKLCCAYFVWSYIQLFDTCAHSCTHACSHSQACCQKMWSHGQLWGKGMLRFPRFIVSLLRDGGEVVSLTYWPYTQKDLLIPISVLFCIIVVLTLTPWIG